MNYIISFDYAALAVLAVVILCSLFKKIYKTKAGRYLMLLCGFTFVTAVLDIACTAAFDVSNEAGKIFLQAMNTLYHVFRSSTSVFFAIYLISLTDTIQTFRKTWQLIVLFFAPVSINFIFLVTNPFHNLFFTVVNENNVWTYVRGPFIYIQYGMAILYLGVGIFYLTKYGKYFSKSKLATLYSFYAVTGATILIQYFFPNLLIELFGNAVTLLLYYIMLHRPEEVLDPRTGVQNRDSFLLDCKRGIDLKKHVYIIVGHLHNYRSLMAIYDSKTTAELMSSIGKRFSNLGKGFGIKATYYTSQEGDFYVVFPTRYKRRAVAFASAVQDFLTGDLSEGRGGFRGKARTILIHQPYDIDDYEGFAYFTSTYWQFPQFKDEVVVLSNYRDKPGIQSLKEVNNLIKDAIKGKKFEVFYQPIYSIKEERYTTCEALIRLHTDKYGYIPPDAFIPFAESSGQITEITQIVVEKVADFVSSYDFKRLGMQSVEINLSIADCLDESLIEKLKKLTDAKNIHPSTLNFEVTETYATDQRDEVNAFLNKLSSLGFQLSLDDFGTGYSNFERLADLPFNLLKMDRTMVQKCGDEKIKKIIPSVVTVGKVLGQKIVIEGIEDEEHLRIFEKYGVDYVQGYYFSKPLPMADFINVVAEKNIKAADKSVK
ncbi:MAG: EAL domain-containing protein [Bacilli bacterium]|nr:EAL domain-containing protein [Bacilli bacterium]